MINNCSVTKYKRVINNDSLEKLGVLNIELQAYSGTNRDIEIDGTEPFTVYIDGEGLFYKTSSIESVIGHSVDAVKSGDVYQVRVNINNTANGDVMYITNKYYLTKIQLKTDSMYVKGGTSVDVSYLEEMVSFQPNQQKIKYSIDTLSKYSKNLEIIECSYNPYVEGDIETMVENMIALGRNSGSMTIKAYASKVKFHGQKFFTEYDDRSQYMTITFGNNSATCTWKESTIATYNGTTWSYV